MAIPHRMNPASLNSGQVLALLAGYLVVAGASVGLLLRLDQLHMRWLDDGRIRVAVLVLPIVLYSVLAARWHRNYAIAVLGSLLGIGIASMAGACLNAFTEPDDEFAPIAVIILLGPILLGLMWVPAALIGIITVRVIRGRWGKSPIGVCPACGYDLSGLRILICPECGAEIARNLSVLEGPN